MKTVVKKTPFIIVVCGPTATGKSEWAVKIARKIDGEVISADSRQVYRGLSIGTGKITKREMRGVPHHLLDIASPKKQFSAAQFSKLARAKILEIFARGKTPILCGGTGLYIDAVLGEKKFPDVPPNILLRKHLSRIPTHLLFEKLKRLDPLRAKTIDSQNPPRLIRAIEIAKALGKVPPEQKNLLPYPVKKIGLDYSDEILKARIARRLASRIRHGMIAEAKRLRKEGLSWKRMEELGLEYRFLSFLLRRKITRKEFEEKLEKEIWHYAKRQRTWFRKDKNILWIGKHHSRTLSQILKNLSLQK